MKGLCLLFAMGLACCQMMTCGNCGAQSHKPLVLVTEAEARISQSSIGISSDDNKTDGPIIEVFSPENEKSYTAPLPVKVIFRENGDPVDMNSLKVTYLKLFGIDLTERVLPYKTGNGFDVRDASLPSGSHRIRVAIKDTKGRLSSMVVSFEVE